MYSRCRIEPVAVALLALTACDKATTPALPAEQPTHQGVITSELVPAIDHALVSEDPRVSAYYNSTETVATGKRLYTQYNCSGCHSNGGGGMGPSLMDDEWVYGSRLEQIHQTLVEGRPNGMPSWATKMPDRQLWELSAYVRSMSLPATIAAERESTPSQNPAPVPPEVGQNPGWSPAPSTTNSFTTLTQGPG